MWTAISGYCAIISISIGIAGLILSGLCVKYSKKAYEAAQAIFEKGILMDKQKILDEVCLDFVMGFIIPYNDFKAEMHKYWDPDRIKKNSEIKVSEIQASLRDKGFKSGSLIISSIKAMCGMLWTAGAKVSVRQRLEALLILKSRWKNLMII